MPRKLTKSLTLMKAAEFCEFTEASAAEWTDALQELADTCKEDGESMEQAFARLTLADKTFAKMDFCRRQAAAMEMEQISKARQNPLTKGLDALAAITPTPAEVTLHRLTEAAAMATGQSYAKAYAELFATSEGQELVKRMRHERRELLR